MLLVIFYYTQTLTVDYEKPINEYKLVPRYLTHIFLQIAVFWDVIPYCAAEIYQSF